MSDPSMEVSKLLRQQAAIARFGSFALRQSDLMTVLTEAALSFLGIGTPATIPTWGNMIASMRSYFTLAPWSILFPGLAVSIAVLAINLFGDGLRDRLDPRLARRVR